jgi:hypothetical protein
VALEWFADGGFGRLLGDYFSVSWTGGKRSRYALASTPVRKEFRGAPGEAAQRLLSQRKRPPVVGHSREAASAGNWGSERSRLQETG